MCLTARVLAFAQTSLHIFASMHASQDANVCRTIFFFFGAFYSQRENDHGKKMVKKHEKTQVRTNLIIKKNPSICSAGPGAGSAEKHGKKKKKTNAKAGKEVMRFLRGGREKSVFTIPLFGLANFLLAVGSTEMRAC